MINNYFIIKNKHYNGYITYGITVMYEIIYIQNNGNKIIKGNEFIK